MTVNRSMKRVKFMLALIRLVRRTQAVPGERRLLACSCRQLAGNTYGVTHCVVSLDESRQAAETCRLAAYAPRNSIHAFPVATFLTNHGLFTSFMQSFAALG